MIHPASLTAEQQVMFESNEGVVTEFADASLHNIQQKREGRINKRPTRNLGGYIPEVE